VLFAPPRPGTYKVVPGTTRDNTSDSPFDAMSKEVDGFDDFFANVLPRTLRAARCLTGDPWTAEEVAVEALARAQASWARIAPLPWRDAWVLRVTCTQALRRIWRPTPLSALGLAGNESEGALGRELVACLRRLPRREREATVLRYICKLPEPDVALALGMSARTVKARLQSATALLRANIEVDIEEEDSREPHI
jgi:RNA polymerase sigma-70 factor (ECF subfamily)